jgi:ubiquitin-like protein Pup
MEVTTTTGSRRTAAGDALPIYVAAESTQKKTPKKGGGEGEERDASGSQKLAKRGKELKEEMDALVDEIDEVLEENAEEFVKNYVQRGGE